MSMKHLISKYEQYENYSKLMKQEKNKWELDLSGLKSIYDLD